jgi:hypothetical protein
MRQQPPYVDEFLTVSIPHTQVLLLLLLLLAAAAAMRVTANAGQRGIPPDARGQDPALRHHVSPRRRRRDQAAQVMS